MGNGGRYKVDARTRERGAKTVEKQFAQLDAGEVYGCDADLRGVLGGVVDYLDCWIVVEQTHAGTDGCAGAAGVWAVYGGGILFDVWRRAAGGLVANSIVRAGAVG